MTYKNFEDYLSKVFADSVRFTEDDPLDDDFPDAFDNWLCDLDVDDFIKHGDDFAKIWAKQEGKK